MAEVAYFFDTYAIVELIRSNPAYQRFADEDATFTVFNLAEVYWVVLKDYGAAKANAVFEQYKSATVDIDDDTLKEAVQFRLEHKRRDLSYADCIGYIYARRHGMLFLTGDKEFEGMDAVEFVK